MRSGHTRPSIRDITSLERLVSHLFVKRRYSRPVPLVFVSSPLGAGDFVPSVVVEPRRSVEIHTVDSTTSTHNLPGRYVGFFVLHLRIWQRLDGPPACHCAVCTPSWCWRVKCPWSVFHIAVLNNKNGFYTYELVSLYMATDQVYMLFGNASDRRLATTRPEVPPPAMTKS